MNLIEKLPFEWQIGLRYTRAGRKSGRSRFLSVISFLSILGISQSVATLIVVLSVMNGFQTEVRDRMLSILAHIEVFDAQGGLADWHKLALEVARNSQVLASAPYVDAPAMLTHENAVRGVGIRGILPQEEVNVAELAQQMREGRLDALRSGEFNMVLGSELATVLKAKVGQKVTLLASQGQVTPAGVLPRLKQFTVVGIFEAGHYEYDSKLAFVHLDDAQKMFRLTGPTGLRVKVKDMQRAPEIAMQLSRSISSEVYLRDWTRQNRAWFAALETEKRIIFVILTLIVAVAAFNLVSSLVITVTGKHGDIAILRTLGANPASIMKVFIVQGALIGLIGTAIGVAEGIALALNVDVIIPALEQLLHTRFVPRDIYLISTLPSDLHASDVLIVSGIALLLALVATLYPSWSAARVRPAEALRYE